MIAGRLDTMSGPEGSCGNSWANDVIRRSYSVRSNGDGTFTVFETDIGSFIANAGFSPGKCEQDSQHGTAVIAGVRGGLAGYLTGTVSCTPGPSCVLNSAAVAAACPTSASPCTRDVFVAAAFGPTARWSCLSGSDPCRFRFDYVAQDQGLIYHHWTDEGTATSEHFSGDIANV